MTILSLVAAISIPSLATAVAQRAGVGSRLVLLAGFSYAIAAPVYIFIPLSAEVAVTTASVIGIIFMISSDPSLRRQAKVKASSLRFRVVMYGFAPGFLLVVVLAAAWAFPDVPKLPLIVTAIAGIGFIFFLASWLTRGRDEN